MKTFKEICEKMQELTEIKLSRAFAHFMQDEYPVAIITAFRDQYTRDENLKRNKQLALELRSAGYGYVYVDGGWEEEVAAGQRKFVEEDSIMVMGNKDDQGKLKSLLVDMAVKYNQDGFLYKESNSLAITIVDKYGASEGISNRFRLDKFEYGYTRLRGKGKGKVFSFHEAREADSGFGKRLASLRKGS